ncbi:MAG: lipid-A-disaccharide synthase [Proteobacteria bacterium]|nr:lipid-A-disaccharide synthase [Pseudomonadota bacterium]
MSQITSPGTIAAGSKKILLVAGEASADLHASHVVRELKRIDPSVHLYGIGGDELRRAGMEILFDARDLSVVGIVEVVSRLPHIRKVFNTLKRQIEESPPGLLILLDYPDFNLRLAAVAKKHRVPVLYYISPQIWAWRQGRVKKIARIVDQMAVVFPFEVPLYEKEGVPVQFVGHPLLDREIPAFDSAGSLEAFGMKPGWPVIGLLPGSRKSEIERLLPVMLAAAERIQKEYPLAQFIIPVAPGIRREEIEIWVAQKKVPVTVVENQLHRALQVCSLALVASGTATLETALMKKPMIILYKISFLTYLIGRLMIRVPCIGLANIVAGTQVVPELIQADASPQRIAGEALALLKSPERLAAMERDLGRIRERLGAAGASARVARIAYDLLNKTS